MQINYRKLSPLLVLFLAIAAANAVSAAPPSQGDSRKTFLGEFAINNYAVLRTVLGAGTITLDMTGPRLSLISPRYKMDAPDIKATAEKGGKPVQYKVVGATATGGVRIVVKDAASSQTTTLTCDKAVYHATPNSADRGRLDLSGHVRSVTSDPALAEPLVQESESGSVTFPDATKTVIELVNGNITGTPREPAAAARKK